MNELKNAEATIGFIQEEHRQILSGLHREIERLQHKCSDLQLELSSYTSIGKSPADLQKEIEQLRATAVVREAVIDDLTSKLNDSLQRVQSLEADLRWQEVEHKNEVESKESKILELRQNLSTNVEIRRLQNECKRLYELTRNSAGYRIDHVADLARRQTIEDLESVESEKRKFRKDGSEDGDSIKWRSLESPTSSGTVSFATTTTTSPDRKNSVESRSKVFRHKLQKIYSLDIRDWSVDAPNVVDRNDRGEQSLLLYSFENPPSSLPVIGYQRRNHSSLPVVSSASASTTASTTQTMTSLSRFPPIVPGRGRDLNQDLMSSLASLSLSASMSSLNSVFQHTESDAQR